MVKVRVLSSATNPPRSSAMARRSAMSRSSGASCSARGVGGVIPWSASTVGYVEATREDTAEKNRLCPPVVFTGWSADLLHLARAGMTGMLARRAEADFVAWSEGARLNPAGGATSRGDDPELAKALAVLSASVGPAMRNFERTLGPALST